MRHGTRWMPAAQDGGREAHGEQPSSGRCAPGAALAPFDLARLNAFISRLIAESSSSIWARSNSCGTSRRSQDGIYSRAVARLGIGRHLAPHPGRRKQRVPIGRQPGQLGQLFAFIRVLENIEHNDTAAGAIQGSAVVV